MTIVAAPVDPRPVAEPARDDAQVARGERERAAEDALAHTGQELGVRLARCRRR